MLAKIFNKYLPLLLFFSFSCASPLKTDTVSFGLPSAYKNHKEVEGLQIAIIPVDSPQKLDEIFGTDLKEAKVLPFQLIVENTGNNEFEINSQQIFGITSNQQLTVAYSLNKTAEHVRKSSIGTTAATHAIAGALAGAAVGAAIGAAAGNAADDTSGGAGAGAAIGGAVGGTAGASAGLSDSITLKFKKELAALEFGDRVIFPGDIQQGFIYLKWKPYQTIRIKLFNITDNKIHEIKFNVSVNR